MSREGRQIDRKETETWSQGSDKKYKKGTNKSSSGSTQRIDQFLWEEISFSWDFIWGTVYKAKS